MTLIVNDFLPSGQHGIIDQNAQKITEEVVSVKYGESSFDILYLLFAVFTGILILSKADHKTEKLMGWAALILGMRGRVSPCAQGAQLLCGRGFYCRGRNRQTGNFHNHDCFLCTALLHLAGSL